MSGCVCKSDYDLLQQEASSQQEALPHWVYHIAIGRHSLDSLGRSTGTVRANYSWLCKNSQVRGLLDYNSLSKGHIFQLLSETSRFLAAWIGVAQFVVLRKCECLLSGLAWALKQLSNCR